MWAKVVAFLTALPKGGNFFGDESQHVWGCALWTFFFLTVSGAPWWVVILVAVALASLHEFWYDKLLPGAPPMGSLRSDGRLENWAGYMVGIALGAELWRWPNAGVAGFWIVAAAIFGTGVVQAIKARAAR